MMADTTDEALVEELARVIGDATGYPHADAWYGVARASIINGEAARLGEVAEHLRAQGSEVERLRAAANAAFDLLGGIDGAAEARDLLLAGLMPAPPLAATSEEG